MYEWAVHISGCLHESAVLRKNKNKQNKTGSLIITTLNSGYVYTLPDEFFDCAEKFLTVQKVAC